jgi:phosphonate transport system substrate-binding protein
VPMHPLPLFLRLFALLAALCALPAAAGEPALHFGVFPRWNAQTMVRDFTPLARTLEKQLGRKVLIETDKDFDSFMRRVYAREFDLVHINQLQYIQAHDRAGYRAIAKLCTATTCTISALLVTRQDSGVSTVAQLRGKTIAFGDPNAMVSYLLARSLLRKAGLQDGDYKTVFTHNPPNALFAVYNGAAAAAGVGSPVFEQPEVVKHVDRQRIVVLAESVPIPHLPFAVRSDLDAGLVAKIRAALIALADQPGGLELLRHIGATRLVSADDAEYAVLRPYVAEGEPDGR